MQEDKKFKSLTVLDWLTWLQIFNRIYEGTTFSDTYTELYQVRQCIIYQVRLPIICNYLAS